MGTDASDYIAHFTARVLQDALNEATATYWQRRAEMLEWAMPRGGDHFGHATRTELEDRLARLRDEAQACRNRAQVALIPGPIDADISDAIAEAS